MSGRGGGGGGGGKARSGIESKDLLRQALESRKTTSRKQRAKQEAAGLTAGQAALAKAGFLEAESATSSRPGSRPGSRASSRAQSRAESRAGSATGSANNTDDEDDDFSDSLVHSTGSLDINGASSLDSLIYAEEDEEIQGTWEEELRSRASQILNPKRTYQEGREQDLAMYIYLARKHYSHHILRPQLQKLLEKFAKDVKDETSEKEVLLALKAIEVSTVTAENPESVYPVVSRSLKAAISSSENLEIKARAIFTLSVVSFFGEESAEDESTALDYLLEIVTSDGSFVDAEDSIEVVRAALEGLGLLSTKEEDLEDTSQDIIEALADQLESPDIGVQVAAGEDIALMYEKSYTEVESDEDLSDSDEDARQNGGDTGQKQRYEPYRQKGQLLQALRSLSNPKTSQSRRTKKEKSEMQSSFADILQSVENPRLGPKYSTAIDNQTGRHYGSRLNVKLSKTQQMRIDKWWKLHRLKMLRKILQHGFLEHYENNPVVLDTLPALTTNIR